MTHSPELLLLLHNVRSAELHDELRGRARGERLGLTRRAWSAAVRTVGARADARRPDRLALDCVAPCAA